MSEKLRLHGGPLEGLYVDVFEVIDGKFKVGIERETWRPAKKEMYFVWKIAESGSAETYVTYEMRDGKLCCPWWKDPKELLN